LEQPIFTVLIVDDDADLAPALAKTLTIEGIRAVIAHNADAAAELARKHRPHAVLLDLGADGPEYALAEILRGSLAPTTAIVMLTGKNVETPDPVDPAGIDFVLRKPVNLDLLGGLLRYVHGQRKQKA